MFRVCQDDLLFVRNAKDTQWAARKVATNKSDRLFLAVMCAMMVLVFIMGTASAMMGVTLTITPYQCITAIGFLVIVSGYCYARLVFLKKLIKAI